MSPQNVADAANISPYPFVVRQDRQPNPPAESSDRGRNAKGKKPKAKPRAERNPSQGEEIRFNTGPRNLRGPSTNRGGRRGFRMPGRGYADDHNGVPDYPPPSFQEAMTTPPLSVCSSTTSLVPAPPLPLVIPENIPEHPEVSEEGMAPVAEATEPENTDNASDSDESLFIIEMNSVPVCSTDLPKGAALEERVRKDWISRRGFEFPGRSTAPEATQKGSDNKDNKTLKRGRTMTKLKLEIDPLPSPTEDHRRLSPISNAKRKIMSLSPLRTFFPPKSPVHRDRAMSAHPSSPSTSPYAASRSTFFRSSSTLAAASFLGLPLLSSVSLATVKSEPLSRKIFSNRGKEHLDAWEVLSEDSYADVDKNGDVHPRDVQPRSLMSAVESLQSMGDLGGSPTSLRSQSFTFGTHAVKMIRAKQSHLDSLEATRGERSSHTPHVRAVTSLRDWKGPSNAFLDRPISRRVTTALSELPNTPTTPITSSLLETPTAEVAPPLPGPPLTSVRIHATSPSPPPSLTFKHTALVANPSLLRTNAKPNVIIDKQPAAAVAMHQRALETPLPITPVYYTRFDYGGSPHPSSPARPVPDLLANSISDEPPTPRTTSAPHLSISVQPPSAFISSVNSSSMEEPMTPTRHHYAGRPLPRPPPSTSRRTTVIDSIYAPSGSPRNDADKSGHLFNSCPEGLLIDLEDTTLDNFSVSGTSTPRSPDGRFASPHLSTIPQASSSVELLGDPATSLSFDSMQATSTPLLPPSSGPSRIQQSAAFSDLTDLDLLVSRIGDGERDGSDYDTLLLVQEVLGPANPTQTGLRAPPPDRVSPPKSSNHNDNMSLIGRIEIARRRQTADGRIKLKIRLLDVAVERCGICLSQFREGDMAVLTSNCQHSFHEKCLEQWLARAKTCPMCRVPLDTDIR